LTPIRILRDYLPFKTSIELRQGIQFGILDSPYNIATIFFRYTSELAQMPIKSISAELNEFEAQVGGSN
jgi:hypothetical protein